MRELNLEGNKLGDHSVILICAALENNSKLSKLNLARNFLTNLCTTQLSATLQSNQTLTELYLYWNKIQGQGANNILKGIQNNTTLKVLDLAWNSIGLHSAGFAKNFAEFIAANTSLVLVDLSNNNFMKDDPKTIAQGLEQNQTAYEFHFAGNKGYVDSFGYLQSPDHYTPDPMGQHITLHVTG